MNKLWLRALVVLSALLGATAAQAQSTGVLVVSSCGNQTFTAGRTVAPFTIDVTGLLCGKFTLSPAGTQDVNVTKWDGTALGAPSNYGTSPGAVAVPGVNAFVTNTPIGITPTDRTITSATGSSQTVMALNASRHQLVIVNTGNANCGINPTGGTAAIGGAGTLTLTPNGSYSPRIPTLSAVTAICTAGQPLYAEEN